MGLYWEIEDRSPAVWKIGYMLATLHRLGKVFYSRIRENSGLIFLITLLGSGNVIFSRFTGLNCSFFFLKLKLITVGSDTELQRKKV